MAAYTRRPIAPGHSPPLALSRLGYDVVGCKRYSSYGTAFDENVRLLERSGVHVVSTERERELDQIPDWTCSRGTTASSLRRR
jgi:hypothetical protein